MIPVATSPTSTSTGCSTSTRARTGLSAFEFALDLLLGSLEGCGLALRELRRLARLVQTGLLALDLACVAREEALALERDAQLRIRLDERAGDSVTHGAGLTREPAAVDAHAEVVLALDAGDLERRDGDRLPDRAREVLLERAAVDPRGAAAGPEDDARDRGLALAGAAVLGDLATGRVQRLRVLRLVRMLGAGVDLQLRDLLAREPVLREHPLHRDPQHLGRPAVELLTERPAGRPPG